MSSKLLSKTPLITAQHAQELMKSPDVKLLDCTLTAFEDAKKSYLEEHVKDAQWFSVHKISQQNPKLPYLLPSDEVFQKWMKQFGVTNQHTILLYDRPPLAAAARVWWTFKVFGHENVWIINGGLAACKASKFATESCSEEDLEKSASETTPEFQIKRRPEMVYDYEKLQKNILSQLDNPERPLLIDARPPGAFETAHIPGAVNVPSSSLWGAPGEYQGPEALAPKFEQVLKDYSARNPNQAKEIVLYCHGAIVACTLEVALSTIGIQNKYHSTEPSDYSISVYDGSWSDFTLKHTQ